MKNRLLIAAVAVAAAFAATAAFADCSALAAAGVTSSTLKAELREVVPGPYAGAPNTPNGGLNFPMWATAVDDSGKVCAVVNSLSGAQSATSDIWLGSRVISAQKANTANAFSNNLLALSTANLYSAVQPGGSLFGLQESNPVDITVAYRGSASDFGTSEDPLVGSRIGGVNVFGGGLALYHNGKKIGAIGVSGDTSCTDHVVAWKLRHLLQLDGTPNGPGNLDVMIQDLPANLNGTSSHPLGSQFSPSGFGHPTCLFNPTSQQAGGSIIP
jgi:uncharacterized protein GlcG (DUF336 family)